MANQMTHQPKNAAELFGTINNRNGNIRDRANAVMDLVKLYEGDLDSLMPANLDLSRFEQQFILSVKQIPKLLDCDPSSLLKALFTAASMGLAPDPHFGEVYLIPFGKNVQVIPGYKGLMRLVRNSNEVSSICCEAIHQNDEYDYQLGTNMFLKHKPALANRGDIILFYCTATFKDGSSHLTVMNVEEVNKIRDNSQAFKKSQSSKRPDLSPWIAHYEEMGKKTVFRRAYKNLPKALSRQLDNAIKVDDAHYGQRQFDVDQQTGDIIDIWADETNAEIPETTTSPTAKLDEFVRSPEEQAEIQAKLNEMQPEGQQQIIDPPPPVETEYK